MIRVELVFNGNPVPGTAVEYEIHPEVIEWVPEGVEGWHQGFRVRTTILPEAKDRFGLDDPDRCGL